MGDKALHRAVRARRGRENIDALPNRKLNVSTRDRPGMTALHWAVDKNDKEVIQILLNAGCDVSVQSQTGKKALHIAATTGKSELVQI